ncbi:MAG: sortase [Candidatus Shapirobacteria bacterium]
MSLYYYQKKEGLGRRESWPPLYKKGLSAFIFGLGTFLVGAALYPMASYQIKYAPRFTPIYSPVSQDSAWYSVPLVLAKDAKDYTLISSWLAEESDGKPIANEQIEYYSLDIPALKIKNAIVHIGGEDLKKELVQYVNTASPGENFGRPVIFGHSTTYMDPDNYMAIFTDLYRLKTGPSPDSIIIHYDGIRYVYQVVDIFEVVPSDLSILSQYYEGKELYLVTCTPPGTYLRRLVVKARLVEE